MRTLKALSGASLLVFVAGCATLYNPLISQYPEESTSTEAGRTDCPRNLYMTDALVRACRLQHAIEKARSEHLRTPPLVATLLIPAAGYVGYRTAMGKSTAPTAAIAAGGLSLYGLSGTIAPSNRVEAYSRGSKAISCALGMYEVALTGTSIAGKERAAFEEAYKAYRAAASAGRQQGLVDYADLVHSIVSRSTATSLLDAQLDRFTRNTVEELNQLLLGTLPTFAGLGEYVATFSAKSSTLPSQPSPAGGGAAILSTDLQSTLEQTARALMQAEAGSAPSMDLTACQISTSALSAAGLYRPMALGPGDSGNGVTEELGGTPIAVTITGGQTPYSVTVVSENNGWKPKAEIQMQGGTLLVISRDPEPPSDFAGGSYTVKVWDSFGSMKSVIVKVSKKATPAPTPPSPPTPPVQRR